MGDRCDGCHLTLPSVEVERIRSLPDGHVRHLSAVRPDPRPLMAGRPGPVADVLILVRHGESAGNAARPAARPHRLAPDRTGLDQARSLADAVAGATRLISSPLARARDTAEALGTGLPVEVDDRWVEVDYGEYDGQKLDDVPAEVWSAVASRPRRSPRPAGRAWPTAGARVRAACEELFAEPDGPARGDGVVVVVSHVSPIKAAACWSLGMGDEGGLAAVPRHRVGSPGSRGDRVARCSPGSTTPPGRRVG